MLTFEEVDRLLAYDGENLRWKVRPGRRVQVGEVAGSLHRDRKGKAYWQVRINGKIYLAHRLIWLLVHKAWPENQIDHIDGSGLNNRIENLRDVTNAENQKNAKKRKDNTSGHVGVCRRFGKWVAHIQVSGRKIHLGLFTNRDEAVAARKAAEVKYNFHENHGQ
jgi:HNH endonuclease